MMTMTHVSIEQEGKTQVVARPRHTDALGHTLRDIFSRAPGMPDDMVALIRRLERTH